ncbi:MAG: aminotransferase class III-fold pyridoxal phosphate-dependent enzyme [Planctomycetes bacterium]|nr:aminotransferase class III-fold pyridoxal phosphate-dependent enzyme [Planctomycetota bacterium]
MNQAWWFVVGGLAALPLAHWVVQRLRLSRAKHPSLRGHARWARRIARWVPFYDYDEAEWFGVDGAPAAVQQQRRAAFERLSRILREKAPLTLAAAEGLAQGVSDLDFVEHYRVPFQFRDKVRRELPLGCLVAETRDRHIRDLDGNWSLDVTGAYGANLFGYEVYKQCIERGVERARALGPVLGPYHPVLVDNVRRLQRISGLDEVSFHMSGTEAVMQAVRLARYHTRRSHIVRFCGAYHGWWDGVQAGVGNPRPAHEVYTLKDLSADSLVVLRTRKDIACVLINPLQAMHPNANAPSDSMLVGTGRSVGYDREAYAAWLRQVREVCTQRGIVLIFDEVFLGFRLAPGGAQKYFGVKADLVTYGKTLGGGLPVGVVCGRADLMRRFRPEAPTDICFARGTFNSHPYVMTAMHEFLLYLDRPEVRATYDGLDARWNSRAAALNQRLADAQLPVRVSNMVSIWSTLFTQAGRYGWMFQFYLRAHGIQMSWVGSGRYIFSHDFTDADFAEFADRFVAAARAMQADGWWWTSPELTNKAINRRVLRETLATLCGRRRRRPAALEAAPAAAPALSGAAHRLGPVGHRVE